MSSSKRPRISPDNVSSAQPPNEAVSSTCSAAVAVAVDPLSKRPHISPGNVSYAQPPNDVISSAGSMAVDFAVADQSLTDPQLGGMPNILMVEMQKDDENEVAIAMGSLAEMMNEESNKNWKKNLEEARLLGAHIPVVIAMRKWQHNKEVQEQGCSCLMTLTSASLESSICVSKLGGMEAIIDAMRIFPDCGDNPYYAFFALGNILQHFDNAGVGEAAMRRFVNDLDGILLVVKTMKRFSNDKDIQEAGCFLFKILATRMEFRNAMKKACVVSTVAMAMEKHDDEELQKEAGECLKNLVT